MFDKLDPAQSMNQMKLYEKIDISPERVILEVEEPVPLFEHSESFRKIR